MKTNELKTRIDELAEMEILVETNAGTYGADEAHRAIGVGDPQFADYRIFERVGDGQRTTYGCEPTRAPGRARKIGRAEINDRRAELARLRAQQSRENNRDIMR